MVPLVQQSDLYNTQILFCNFICHFPDYVNYWDGYSILHIIKEIMNGITGNGNKGCI